MANVIGIDADRQRLAVVKIVDGQKSWLTIERTDSRGNVKGAYTAALSGLMASAASAGAVVYLEGIYLARVGSRVRNVETFRVLANVQGEIRYEALRHRVELRLVAPVQWQRKVLGIAKDREKIKAASREEARKLVGSFELSEHESDAACLCLYGLWALANEARTG